MYLPISAWLVTALSAMALLLAIGVSFPEF